MVRLSSPSLLLAVLLGADVGSSRPVLGVSSAPELAPKIKMPSGYAKVLFEDDFTGQRAGSGPSSSKWTVDIGTAYPGGPQNWGTGEIQRYTDSRSNVAITEASTLRITPVLISKGQWTSARIETKPAHDFTPQAGKKLLIESRLRFPGSGATQLGIWPAFWSLGADIRGDYQNWPDVGEIDVIESLNGLDTGWHTVHCGTGAKGGPCDEPSGIGHSTHMSRGDWHVVAVEIDRRTTTDGRGNTGAGDWRGESISWFLDGTRVFSLSGAQLGDATAWTSLARSPRFLLLNVAVGGAFPDAVAKSTTPTTRTTGGDLAAMEVDYVAVFST